MFTPFSYHYLAILNSLPTTITSEPTYCWCTGLVLSGLGPPCDLWPLTSNGARILNWPSKLGYSWETGPTTILRPPRRAKTKYNLQRSRKYGVWLTYMVEQNPRVNSEVRNLAPCFILLLDHAVTHCTCSVWGPASPLRMLSIELPPLCVGC